LIHDAISYMTTREDLLSAFLTAAAHLDSGGVLITAPDLLADHFKAPGTDYASRSFSGQTITYFEYTYDPDPADTMLEKRMIFFIESDGKLRIEQDTHQVGIFPEAVWIECMQEAGFQVEVRHFYLKHSEFDYQMFVGTRVSSGSDDEVVKPDQ